MKFYLATSLQDNNYIILAEDMRYHWFMNLPITLEIDDLYYDDPNDTPQRWLRDLSQHQMLFICEFENYNDVKLNYPELFI